MKNLSTVIFAALFLARGLLAHDPASDMASAATRFLESLVRRKRKKPSFPSAPMNEKIGIFSPEAL